MSPLPRAVDAAVPTEPGSPTVPDAAIAPGVPDTGMAGGARDAAVPTPVLDGGRDGGPGLLPDASSMHFDPSAFAAIQPGQGDPVSAPSGKWSFDTAASACKAPYKTGSNVLRNDQVAGSHSVCFVQLVVNKVTGQAYVQDGMHLWWHWNGLDQWTPEVTGDPRSPTAVPALGPNRFGKTRETFANNHEGWWISLNCKGCSAMVQQVAPEPGGHSLRMEVTQGVVPGDQAIQLDSTFTVELGKVFLMSAWTTGAGDWIEFDHDSTSYKMMLTLKTAGWVQTFCKHIPKTTDSPSSTTGGLWWKQAVWKGPPIAMAHPYIGTVAPDYPAPWCYDSLGQMEPNPLARLKQ